MFEFKQGNHKEQFSKYVEELVERDLPIQERMILIGELTESYVSKFDKRPHSKDLELLADYLLKEHLQDKNPDKMTKEEYPVMSDRQKRTRKSKEFIKEEGTLDYIKLRKTSKHHSLHKKNTSNRLV